MFAAYGFMDYRSFTVQGIVVVAAMFILSCAQAVVRLSFLTAVGLVVASCFNEITMNSRNADMF